MKNNFKPFEKNFDYFPTRLNKSTGYRITGVVFSDSKTIRLHSL